jgi:hypothetical protein
LKYKKDIGNINYIYNENENDLEFLLIKIFEEYINTEKICKIACNYDSF